MARSSLIIGLAQLDIVWENPGKNRRHIENLIQQTDVAFDLLVLPEMFTTGFTMNVTAMAETMEGETIAWLIKQALTWQSDIIGSVIIEEGGAYYNRLIWVNSEGIKATYDKRHLFALAGEDKVFTAGSDKVQLDLKGWQVRPLICYDLRFPVWSRSSGDTDLLIYVANFPDKRRYAWRQLLIARAIENQCFVVGLNRIGWDGMQHFYNGDSMIIDPTGKPILEMGNQGGMGSVAIEEVALENLRHNLPFHLDADNFEIIG